MPIFLLYHQPEKKQSPPSHKGKTDPIPIDGRRKTCMQFLVPSHPSFLLYVGWGVYWPAGAKEEQFSALGETEDFHGH